MKEREKRESVRNGEKERKMKRNDRREKREREKRKRMKARNQDRERRDKTKYDRTCVGTYPRYHSTIYHSLSVFSHLVIMIYGRVTRVFAVTRSRSIKLHSTRFWRTRLVFSTTSS